LNALSAEFPDALPTLPVLHEFLAYLCDEILEDRATDTIFNFLLACGQYTMFAYSWPGKRPGSSVWNGLHYIVREPPFSNARLLDVDYSIDFATVTTHADRVAVITTKPLTHESGWTEFRPGELLMFDKGKPYRTPKCCEQVEKEGRGLVSKCVKNKHSASSPIWRSRRPPCSSPPSLCLSNGNSSSCPGDASLDLDRVPVFRLASSEEAETVLTSPRLPNKTVCNTESQHRPTSDLPLPPFASVTTKTPKEEERQERDHRSSPLLNYDDASAPAPAAVTGVAGALEGCLISDLATSNPRTTVLYTKVLL
jgi:hypothetical protein